MACIKIWKEQRTGVPTASEKNINPNCLKVERATTFLASLSIRAEKLATLNVIKPSLLIKRLLILVSIPNRITNQTPAVTRVEL